MVIKINYTSSDVYVSTSVSPVYVVVNYSAVNNAGGVAWGAITGTLSDQTDLQTALDAKFDDPTGTTAQYLRGDGSLATFPAIPGGTVTSVGLTMPSAFSVANSPVTSSGTLAVTGAGTADQYVRGDGQLANFPTNQGGGSSVNYYLNGSVNQGTFGGDTYYEMSKTPIIGSGTNFTRTNAQGNGYIASFITDAGDPALLNIPGGNWNLEFYFAASSSGSTPSFYAELYKVSSSNIFTLISSGSTNPEGITNGTVIDQYFTSIPVPQTSLLATDRLAIRIFVTPSGRTITLHTEDNNLCEVLTTFSTGLNALNGLTSQVQYFATGTSGTDFAISSATDTHTFNLPTASASNRGALSSADWTTFSGKVGGSGATGQVAYWNGTNSVTGSSNLTYSGGYLTNTNTFTDSAILVMRANQTTYQSFIGVGTVGAYSPTNLFWSFGLVTGNQDFNIQSYNGTTISSRIKIYASTGNISLNAGANADGGQRLQVYGDAFVRGSGATSATSGLLIQNSSSTEIFRVYNDGVGIVRSALITGTLTNCIQVFNNGGGVNPKKIEAYWGGGTPYGMQINTNLDTDTAVGNGYGLQIRNIGAIFTTGDYTNLVLNAAYTPPSGNATYTQLRISPTMNQGGGANGITRGLYVNPTLTAAADWRSIEWSNNSGWGLYGAGTANNYLGGDLTFGNNKGVNLSQAGTNRSSRIYAADILDNYAGFNFYPSAGTNVGNAFQVIPRGTGFNANIKSSITVYNTDYVADSTNYELAVIRAGGANYSISTGKSGTGTTRPLLLSAGFATDAVTNGNQLWLYTSGRVGINTTSESTFTFDVNGTARVSGAVTLSSTVSLGSTVTNTSGGFVHSSTSPTNDAFYTIQSSNTRFYVSSGGYCKSTSNIVTDTNGTPSINASAISQIDSTTKGFLPPRMTTTQKGNITSPAAGLQVYDTTLNQMSYYNGTTWVNF